ncbi:cation:proton antiporter [Humidisolicoccus flavus]|uniref:cation:proton antiporter n=1 Tax=Humidisolicoccus flavus TaxID=3111414 RepID=UPI003245A909
MNWFLEHIVEITGNGLIVIGALVFATAALGVVRFPDAYTRVSAVGTASGLGITFVVVGALLLQPSIPNLVKVVLIILLQLATSAIGSMAIARSTSLTGVPMADPHYNDLDAAKQSRAETQD